MRSFEHRNAYSFEEAAGMLKSGKADAMAGGTDLINVYKEALLDSHPDTVVNLKTIPDAAGIRIEGDAVSVKALTKLVDVAESDDVPKALSEAAYSVATPLIRNMGTIGGNICQDVRCWYYRYPHDVGGRINCSRKGGDTCYAIQGENRYHSVFGGMHTHGGACTRSCPAGTDIAGYMSSLRDGNWDEAAKIIMNVNPMPMLTSRVCPHPCQDACNQNVYGDSVGIHCVERALGDFILENKDRYYCAPEKESGRKAAVIGAGPGGLTAAYYLRKAGHRVTVIDAHEKAGGVLQYGIPHYRLPKSIVNEFADALAGMGIEFKMNTVVGRDIQTEDILKEYDSIYMGTGAWKQPVLGLSGENLTEFGLDFLVEVNSFLKDRIEDDVLVCGGGNVAMDVALTAKRMGAANVTLVCLEQRNEMPASAEEIARSEEEGVIIKNGWGLKNVISDSDGHVTGLESMKCVSVFNEQGRFDPVYDDKETEIFHAKTIILATGQRVDTEFLGEKLGSQIRTARGLFDVDDENFQTKNEKIYAGGDAVTGPNIAISAIHAGGAAGKAMCRKLGSPFVYYAKETGFLKFDAEGVREKKALRIDERDVSERTLTDEDSNTPTKEEALKEASRCMNCGCYSVNASDISPVLVTLDGTIVTTKKEIPAKDFFTKKLKTYDMLDRDELVKEIRVPAMKDYHSGYIKDRLRPAIDFALASLAYAYKLDNGVISDIALTFGGVAPVPVRLYEVEDFLKGRKADEETAEQAAEIAIKDTVPMELNSYKIQTMKTMVKRLLESIC